MADEFVMTTAKPVIVFYSETAEPSPLHPAGVLAGTSFEVPTPEAAFTYHPDARILRYVDGTPFNESKARRELRERKKREEAGDRVTVAEELPENDVDRLVEQATDQQSGAAQPEADR